jgi:hypothetical protein
VAIPRPRFDIADIVRAHRQDLESRHWLSRPQKRVLTAIARCRTAALGGHLEVCACGFERPAYNSCRNRHCPKCQARAQQKWIDARAARILPVPHFHLVFTLPAELRPLAMRHPVDVYTAFFHAVSELLLELGRTRLGATLGLTMVLHTWTRELAFHPHVHVLATAGGLALDGKSFVHRRKFLFPVKVMGQLLRGKMLDALRRLHRKGAFPELTQPAFNRLTASLATHRSWVVYAKAPFRKSQHVLSYLGRYTHRVGIANSRLVEVSEDKVTFNTKHGRTATLHPVEFLRRFVQHVLPDGFHKIRHAGLYAAAQPGGLLAQTRALLPASPAAPKPEPPPIETPPICPHCGALLQRIPLSALARAPPPAAA